MSVDVSRICDFALSGGVYAMDLRGGKRLERWKAECFTEGIDTCVLQELITSLIDKWCVGISL
jgi:hypothetical protein